MKKIQILTFALASLFILTACNGGGTTEEECIVRTSDQANTDFVNTPFTDALKFAQADDLEGKKFAGGNVSSIPLSEIDHYGYVSLRSVTDGDTANFIQEGYIDPVTNNYISIKTRFLGINTPESTAKVQPWGKKASLFVKGKLEAAQAAADAESETAGKKVFNIALITDVPVFGDTETSGRWLAFVWYRNNSTSPWRCINLETVEQAYSPNQLFLDSTVCNYRESFEAADAINKKCKYRIHGELDNGYDYEEQVYEATLWHILNHYADIGISDETGSSGVILHVMAQVVGIQGDSMYLRDVVVDQELQDEGKEEYGSLYCYAGFNSSIASILNKFSPTTHPHGIGLVVYFYARATTYSNNIQLSDLQNKTSGKKAFRVITEANIAERNPAYKWSDLKLDTSTVRVEPSLIKTQDDIGAYKYQWIDTEIEIRKVNTSDDDDPAEGSSATSEYWFRAVTSSGTTSYTYYAKIAGTSVYCNLRADASLNPQVLPAIFDSKYGTGQFNVDDADGKVFHVTGYLVSYFDKYQIQLANNYQVYNYIQEV